MPHNTKWLTWLYNIPVVFFGLFCGVFLSTHPSRARMGMLWEKFRFPACHVPYCLSTQFCLDVITSTRSQSVASCYCQFHFWSLVKHHFESPPFQELSFTFSGGSLLRHIIVAFWTSSGVSGGSLLYSTEQPLLILSVVSESGMDVVWFELPQLYEQLKISEVHWSEATASPEVETSPVTW